MTFEEWFKSVCKGWADQLHFVEMDKLEAMKLAWNAAKEDSKPVADIVYVDYPCTGLRSRPGVPYWAVRNSVDLASFASKQDAQQWAIENGYRVEE